jgi:hypothetical protein
MDGKRVEKKKKNYNIFFVVGSKRKREREKEKQKEQ